MQLCLLGEWWHSIKTRGRGGGDWILDRLDWYRNTILPGYVRDLTEWQGFDTEKPRKMATKLERPESGSTRTMRHTHPNARSCHYQGKGRHTNVILSPGAPPRQRYCQAHTLAFVRGRMATTIHALGPPAHQPFYPAALARYPLEAYNPQLL